jgi:hypothetical protein
VESSQPRARRRLRKRWIALVLIVLLTLAFAILWNQRRQIAGGYIDRELERRGVQARYEIATLGPGVQRLEHVVIGDPAHPDLTADWVELRLSYGLRAPRVTRITARGVRLYGRVVGGKLSLGQIDKLLPPASGKPFTLPNLNLDIADAAMRLDTPVGQIGLALAGRGNLSGGFGGRATALARHLDVAGCGIERPKAALAVSITRRQPSLTGPLRAERVACTSGLAANAPALELNATLAEALDKWTGKGRVQAAALRWGSDGGQALDGRFTFGGDSRLTRGNFALAASRARVAGVSASRLLFSGRYEASATNGEVAADGDVVAAALAARGAAAPAVQTLRSAEGTPLEPFGRSLAAAVGLAAEALDARTHLSLNVGAAGLSARFAGVDARSRSGARLILDGGDGILFDKAGLHFVDGRIALSGGGFPALEAQLEQSADGGLGGTALVQPYVVGSARLALAPIRFASTGKGLTRIASAAVIDAPFSGGAVRRLALPIEGWFGGGGFAFGEGCTPLSFQALRYGTLSLGPTRLPLCPTGRALIWKARGGAVQGGAELRRLRLAGRLGSSPLALASDRFRFDLGRPGFTGTNVAVRLGSPGYVHRLDLAALNGRFTARGLDGTFAGASGQIANVLIAVSEARGRWSVVGSRLGVNAAMRVSDASASPRFNALRSDDFTLTLANNRIEAGGWLAEPETGTRVTRATITHSLDSGRGRVELDVPGITFSEAFQPERLTPVTVGVVALVRGTLQGSGEIGWGPDGTSSSGTFSTTNADFAAPFGPVTGLTTTVHFTDLLGLATAPDQEATVGRIQTGIDVFDGRVRYQLLPGLKVRVQAGEWPFAGGQLKLQETILDFSQESEKHLTFDVVGMDASAFVEQMKFSNIAATGTFDGVVPMVFDNRGGRIVGGHLAARPGGGTVSYIGELTEADLGAYGKLAFDALKSLRYSKLVVTLDGALDGEFVAGVELDGVAREAVTPGGITGYALRQLAKIPFEFNITARGPFRAIIGTMRSLRDPSGLIQQVLPPDIRDRPTTLTVQPKESETVQ